MFLPLPLTRIASVVLMALSSGLWAWVAMADPIFEEDFDDGFATWSASGDVVAEDLHVLVPDSVRLQGGATLTRSVSTSGYQEVSIGFFLAARLLEGADRCLFEVSTDGGAQWSALAVLVDGDDDGQFRWELVSDPAYDDNPDLVIRFRNDAGSADNCYAEEVSVSGFALGSEPCGDLDPPPAFPGYTEDFDPLSGSGATGRTLLTSAVLLAGPPPSSTLDSAAFGVPAAASAPLHVFEGNLELQGEATSGAYLERVDDFFYTGNADDPRKHLPEFAFDFVQTGSHLVPARRGIVESDHPYWEYVVEPGRVWSEAADGGMSRAALPFVLQQRNSNCLHNGLLTFLFDDTQVSKVVYQISSETCLYFQFDMWGLLDATYTPEVVPAAEDLRSEHQRYLAGRLPVAPISQLAVDFPGVDPAEFAHSSEVAPEDLTLFGVIVDGVHYVGGCETRDGLHPYCDSLRVPSYSLAKTAFASTAALRLESDYPGFLGETIAAWVAEAAADPEGDFADVTVEHALDMATGNYLLSGYIADEGSLSTNDFFLPETHAEKVDYAVSRYPRSAPPGTEMHYHTTDTYLAVAAAQRFLREQEGWCADVFDDLIVRDLWEPLGISPGSLTTRRTYDPVAQPFGGYGLSFLRDDLAKVAGLLGVDHGRVNGVQLLAPAPLAAGKFAYAADPGLPWSSTGWYNNAFWGLDRSSAAGCGVIAPYLSGYGGITVALLQSGVVYYFVSDGGSFTWDRAYAEAERLRSSCPAAPPNPPTQLVGEFVAGGLALSWTAAEDPIGVIHYRVLRDGVEVAFTAGNGWTDSAWPGGVAVDYQVESVDSRGVASPVAASLSLGAPAVPLLGGPWHSVLVLVLSGMGMRRLSRFGPSTRARLSARLRN